MKRYQQRLLFLLAVIFSGGLLAQQAPHYTQFMYNMNMVNPAYTGIKNGLALGFLYRTQWTGFEGHPETYTFNIHSRIGDAMGIGLNAFKDKFGYTDQTSANLNYSYTVSVGANNQLAMGINAGIYKVGVDLTSLQAVDPGDPLLAKNINNYIFNYGVGLFLYSDKYYIGVSAPMLNTQDYALEGTNWNQGNAIHYFITGGYVFDLNKDFKLKPHFMVYQAVGSPFAVSLNANLFMYDKLEVGASYRWGDSFSGLINYAITENLRVGYAYDRTVSNMKLFSPNSHEVFLNYVIPYKKRAFMSPLYF